MAMLRRTLRDALVAALAGRVHAPRPELVVGFAAMHRVAGETREPALFRATCVAGGERKRAELAAADAHGAVAPESAPDVGFRTRVHGPVGVVAKIRRREQGA